jgi:cyclin-dependent kinase-like
MFSTNPRFIGYKFPSTKAESLDKRYVGKLSAKAVQLLNMMLKLEPEERFTAVECLAHTYFDGIREPEIDKIIQTYNISGQN